MKVQLWINLFDWAINIIRSITMYWWLLKNRHSQLLIGSKTIQIGIWMCATVIFYHRNVRTSFYANLCPFSFCELVHSYLITHKFELKCKPCTFWKFAVHMLCAVWTWERAGTWTLFVAALCFLSYSCSLSSLSISVWLCPERVLEGCFPVHCIFSFLWFWAKIWEYDRILNIAPSYGPM